jgi:hypothetical protein
MSQAINRLRIARAAASDPGERATERERRRGWPTPSPPRYCKGRPVARPKASLTLCPRFRSLRKRALGRRGWRLAAHHSCFAPASESTWHCERHTTRGSTA